MKKYLSVTILLVVFLASCHKDDDLKGDERIGGRLFYHNPYSGDVQAVPLRQKKVFIAYNPSDTLNYIYSVVTDDEGYFKFTNLTKDTWYNLFYQDTIADIKYAAFLPMKPGDETVTMIATPDETKQNGIYVVAKDAADVTLDGIAIVAYDNHAAYLNDSAALVADPSTTTNGLHTFKTNKFGYDFWFNIAAHPYYLIALAKAGTLHLMGTGFVNVGSTGVTKADIVLSAVPVINSVQITLMDNSFNPVSGIPLYLYTSAAIADADTANRTSYANKTESKSNGIAGFLNLAPATYFIRAEKQIGTTWFRGSGMIVVPAGGLVTDTVVIQ